MVTDLQLRHQLPHRLRFGLPAPVEAHRFALICWHVHQLDGDLLIRLSADRRGVVVLHAQDQLICPALVATLLQQALIEGPIHGPECPPSAWQRWLGGTRQLSIRLLMGMAIAGWILPVLPGTPFFLMAWWLGWRPDPTDDSDGSTESKPEQALLERSTRALTAPELGRQLQPATQPQ